MQIISAYRKKRPYLNSKYKELIPEIQAIIKANKYGSTGTDVVTLRSEGHKIIYLIDHSANSELADNLRDGDGFGIRDVFNINTITADDCRRIIRNIAADYGFSEIRVRNRLQELRIRPEILSGLDIAAELQMVSASNDSVVLSDGGERGEADNNGRGVDGRESQKGARQADRIGDDGIETFTTPQGEVYGFVDKDGNIYLDETKISPEHPIHEYTHLWDRTVKKFNLE